MSNQLFVFEGIDGSGKTSVVSSVKKMLETSGYKVKAFREPTDMEWGRKIRNVFKSGKRLPPEEEAKYFNNDRKENVEKRILPALKDGFIVLLDRYYFSTAAYQGAAGLNWKDIIEENEIFAPKPKLVFFLIIEPEIGLKRIKKQGRSNTAPEKLDILTKVSEEYQKIFAGIKRYKIVEINANDSLNKIVNKSYKKIVEKLS